MSPDHVADILEFSFLCSIGTFCLCLPSDNELGTVLTDVNTDDVYADLLLVFDSYSPQTDTQNDIDDEYEDEDEVETDDEVDADDSAADINASLYVDRHGDGQDSPVTL